MTENYFDRKQINFSHQKFTEKILQNLQKNESNFDIKIQDQNFTQIIKT